MISRSTDARLLGLGEILVGGLLVVTPFVLVPAAADAFDLPKQMVAEMFALASLLALALRALLNPRLASLDLGPKELWEVPAVRALLPLGLVASLGLVVSSHGAHVRQALPDLWIGVACVIGWSVGLSPRRQRRLLVLLALPAVVLGALAILQFHELYRPFAFSGGEEAARLGLTSLAGNAGVLAAFLVLPALLAQEWGWRRRQHRPSALAALVTVVVCLYGIAVSQTVAAVLAVVLGSACLWLVQLPRRRALTALGAAAAVLLVTIAAVAPLRSKVVAKVTELTSGEWNKVLTGRLDGWSTAWWMVQRNPLTGVGHGAYSAEFAEAKIALTDDGHLFLQRPRQVMFVNAHNEFLEVAAEWGLVGVAALAWALWVLWRRLRGLEPADRPLAYAGCVGLGILAVAHFPFRVALVAFPALLFLSWILSPGEGELPEPAAVAAVSPKSGPPAASRKKAKKRKRR
ncbi:MAG: O-antigen ligase family protein [Acidobacteriota bacterium]